MCEIDEPTWRSWHQPRGWRGACFATRAPQPLKIYRRRAMVISSPALSLRIQNVACLGFRDQRIRIFLQQETSGHRIGYGSPDRKDISRVSTVALLQRQARVAAGQTLGSCLGKRNPAALVVAHLALVETARGDVPAQISTERRLEQHHRHTAEFVAVFIRSRNLQWNDLLDDRRLEQMKALV